MELRYNTILSRAVSEALKHFNEENVTISYSFLGRRVYKGTLFVKKYEDRYLSEDDASNASLLEEFCKNNHFSYDIVKENYRGSTNFQSFDYRFSYTISNPSAFLKEEKSKLLTSAMSFKEKVTVNPDIRIIAQMLWEREIAKNVHWSSFSFVIRETGIHRYDCDCNPKILSFKELDYPSLSNRNERIGLFLAIMDVLRSFFKLDERIQAYDWAPIITDSDNDAVFEIKVVLKDKDNSKNLKSWV